MTNDRDIGKKVKVYLPKGTMRMVIKGVSSTAYAGVKIYELEDKQGTIYFASQQFFSFVDHQPSDRRSLPVSGDADVAFMVIPPIQKKRSIEHTEKDAGQE